MAHRDDMITGTHRARMAFFNHQQEYNKLSNQYMNGELSVDQFMLALKTIDGKLMVELQLAGAPAQ